MVPYELTRIALADGRRPRATVVGDVRLVNLTRDTLRIRTDEVAPSSSVMIRTSGIHVAAERISGTPKTIAGLRVNWETFVLEGDRLPDPEPGTYFLVDQDVLRTREAKGRTDLLAPVGATETSDGSDPVYGGLIHMA